MSKTGRFRLQWHTGIIALVFLALSAISWIQTAGEITDLADIHLSEDGKADAGWSVFKKKELSRIDTYLTFYGTGEIASVQVLAGKGKWLFYKTKTDGNPIADYEGTNKYTPQQMEQAAGSARKVQDELDKRGTKLAVLFVPNKENIYSEYMPDTYVHAAKSRTDRLAEFMAGEGIRVVSPKQELLDIHSDRQIYYYYDSHWNQLGAYIGVRETLASWGISIPGLADRTWSSKGLAGNYHYHAQDDLSRLAGLRPVLTDDIEYEIDGTLPMDWKTYEKEQSSGAVSHFTNEDAVNRASILLTGDSFRSSMVPALREQFTDVYVAARSAVSAALLDEIHPDYMIVEYAERHSNKVSSIESLIQ